jgi:hypothetical protein
MKLPAFSVAEPDYHDFSPPLLRLQASLAQSARAAVLWLLAALLGLADRLGLIGGSISSPSPKASSSRTAT